MEDDSKIDVLIERTVKTVQKLMTDIAGSDISHERLKELCKEVCQEKRHSLQNICLVDEKHIVISMEANEKKLNFLSQ